MEDEKLIRLDLACGDNKRPDDQFGKWLGVDIIKLPNVDIVHDLEVYPWPIKDKSVDEIFCSHYIEHTKDLMKFMNECHRILKDTGKMAIIAPYYNSVRAWQDPTHVRAISEFTFMYFNKEWRKNNKLEHYPITCDFDFSYGYILNGDWVNRSEEARQFAFRHYTNCINDIQVTMTKRPEVK